MVVSHNFEFQGNIHDGEMMELTFEGLDTYATVYLNGVELGSTENMFISHTFDVTRELKIGKNVLAVKFDPIQMRIKDKVQYYWSGFSKKRVWTRKAQSHFGWDWGPRLVCAGIWKDVHLKKESMQRSITFFLVRLPLKIIEQQFKSMWRLLLILKQKNMKQKLY